MIAGLEEKEVLMIEQRCIKNYFKNLNTARGNLIIDTDGSLYKW